MVKVTIACKLQGSESRLGSESPLADASRDRVSSWLGLFALVLFSYMLSFDILSRALVPVDQPARTMSLTTSLTKPHFIKLKAVQIAFESQPNRHQIADAIDFGP